MRVRERDAARARLLRAGVETKVEYAPSLLEHAALRARFGWRPEAFPVAWDAREHGLSLPVHPFVGAGVQERVIDVLGSLA